MPADPPWFIASWLDVVERPELLDQVLDREDRYAGVAVLALVLNHEDPEVVLPRVKRAMASGNPQTRVNALQSLGHFARLHGYVDAEAFDRLCHALRDRTMVGGRRRRPRRDLRAEECAAPMVPAPLRRTWPAGHPKTLGS